MTVEDDVLDVVRKFCEDIDVTYTPDVVVNGRAYFLGEDAEDLIYAAADRIGFPRAEVHRHFPFGTYFEPETPFSPLLGLLLLAKRIFGRPELQRPPLTALAFARLLADLKRTTERPTEEDRPSHEYTPE
jgi:hypothetical protein